MNLWGNRLLQNNFIDTFCEMTLRVPLPGTKWYSIYQDRICVVANTHVRIVSRLQLLFLQQKALTFGVFPLENQHYTETSSCQGVSATFWNLWRGSTGREDALFLDRPRVVCHPSYFSIRKKWGIRVWGSATFLSSIIEKVIVSSFVTSGSWFRVSGFRFQVLGVSFPSADTFHFEIRSKIDSHPRNTPQV